MIWDRMPMSYGRDHRDGRHVRHDLHGFYLWSFRHSASNQPGFLPKFACDGICHASPTL